MKLLFILIFSLSFTVAAVAQDSPGFTNKAEAENKMVNGVKEGKWIEYWNEEGYVTNDSSAPYYVLKIYKNGGNTGIERVFYKSGKICSEPSIFKNGKGTVKYYYENGNLERINYFSFPLIDSTKHFDENGNEIR